jgi:hypothetical protein
MFAPALPGFPTAGYNVTNLDRKSGIRGPKTMGQTPTNALQPAQAAQITLQVLADRKQRLTRLLQS